MRIATLVTDECEKKDLQPMKVMKLALKYLGLSESFVASTLYVPKTQFETRNCVWQFWHTISEESTITTALARLRVSERHGCQQDLEHIPTVRIVKKRNRDFYISIWKTYSVPAVVLYKKYCLENPISIVSYGMFLQLRPFYVRNVSLKDMEMCVCKIHLHARWCISSMLKIFNKASIGLPFDSYNTFFDILYSNCDHIDNTYKPWYCTPDKNTICEHISINFNNIMSQMEALDEKITTPFTYFQKESQYNEKGELLLNKNGKPVKRLVPKKIRASGKFLVHFMREMLSNFVHHRNNLRLYRNIKHTFLEQMKAVYVDTDFSENLTIGMKKEPQSLHWCKTQVTVHSAIVKFDDKKAYHPYISDSRKHDPAFITLSFKEIKFHTDVPQGVWIVWETDNCAPQCKSGEHFYDCQKEADELMSTIVRLWGIAMHGKGEVDHVGGVAKVAARGAIAGDFNAKITSLCNIK